MKRVWAQITVSKATQEAMDDNALQRQKIRIVNSLASQMERSGAITITIKDALIISQIDDQEQVTLQADVVVMTVEEARFLMKHARDVTSDELDMALKLQEDAKHLFMELEEIPREELPMELRDRRNET